MRCLQVSPRKLEDCLLDVIVFLILGNVLSHLLWKGIFGGQVFFNSTVILPLICFSPCGLTCPLAPDCKLLGGSSIWSAPIPPSTSKWQQMKSSICLHWETLKNMPVSWSCKWGENPKWERVSELYLWLTFQFYYLKIFLFGGQPWYFSSKE